MLGARLLNVCFFCNIQPRLSIARESVSTVDLVFVVDVAATGVVVVLLLLCNYFFFQSIRSGSRSLDC